MNQLSILIEDQEYEIIKVIKSENLDEFLEVNSLDKKKFIIHKTTQMNEKEFHKITQLNNDNILKIFQIVNKNDHSLILMEHFESDLQELLKKKIKFAESDIHNLISCIANGLKYLSDNNIIHRDLKPENIYIQRINDLSYKGSQYLFKIGGFNFAKEANVTETQNIGTIYYLAPEIILGKKYDQQIDIWALGIIIYQVINGKLLFDGNTNEQIKEQILSMNNNQNNPFYKTIQQLNPPYNQLIYQMLQFDPYDRLTFNQIIDQLQLNGQIIQQNNENRNFSQPKITNQNLFQIQNQIKQSNCNEQHNNQLQNQFEKQCQQLFQQNQQFLITKTDEIMCKLFNYNKELILKKNHIKQQILQIKLDKNKYFEEVNKLKQEVIKLNEEVNKLQKNLDIKDQTNTQLEQLISDLIFELQQSQNKNQEIIHSQNIENQQFNDKIQSLIKTNQSLLQKIKMHENNNNQLNNKINEIKIQNDKQNQIIQKNKIQIVELTGEIKQLNEYIKQQDFKEQSIINFSKLNEQNTQEEQNNNQIEQIQNHNTKEDEYNQQIEQKNNYIAQLEKQVEKLIQQKTSLEYNLIPQQKIEVISSNKTQQSQKSTNLLTHNTSFQDDHNVKQIQNNLNKNIPIVTNIIKQYKQISQYQSQANVNVKNNQHQDNPQLHIQSQKIVDHMKTENNICDKTQNQNKKNTQKLSCSFFNSNQKQQKKISISEDKEIINSQKNKSNKCER